MTTDRARTVAGLCLRTIPRLMGLVRGCLREAGTASPLRMRVLRMLSREQLTAGELAERAGVSAPTISAVLTALEGDGMLTRAVDEQDRRRVLVSDTEKGAQTLAEVDRKARETVAEALASLTEDELARVEDGLTLLGQVLVTDGKSGRRP